MANSIFIGVREIAGRYESLFRGIQSLGFDVKIGILYPPPEAFYSSEDCPNGSFRHFNRAQKSKVSLDKSSSITKLRHYLSFNLHSLRAMIRTIPSTKIYLFSFGTTFFPLGLDIILLRSLGKKVVVYYGHGSDCRPAFFQAKPSWDRFLTGGSVTVYVLLEVLRSLKIRWVTWISSLTISTMAVDHYISGRYVESFLLGVPSLSGTNKMPPLSKDDSLTIAHFPSSFLKGTEEIRSELDAIGFLDILQEKSFEAWIPRRALVEKMGKATALWDQKFLDIPISASGVEAGFQATAVIAQGTGPSNYRQRFPGENFPPIIEDFHELTQGASRGEVRKKLEEEGRRLKNFLDLNWSLDKVSKRYWLILTGAPEAETLQTPSRSSFQPMGLTSTQIAHRLKVLDKSRLFRMMFPRIRAAMKAFVRREGLI